MKRNVKTEKRGEFIRLMNEAKANYEARRKLGYKPLDEPVHHGYNAKWTLRSDVANREDADNYQEVIDNYGIEVWSKKKDFKKWSYKFRRNVDVYPSFKDINVGEYEKLSQKIKKFFTIRRDTKAWGGVERIYYEVNIPVYFLVMKVRKNYRTHYKVLDEVLLQEKAEIEGALWGKFYDMRVGYYNRSSKKWLKKFTSRSNRAKNKATLRKNLMSEIYDGDEEFYVSWALSCFADDPYEFTYNNKSYYKW